MSSLEWLVHIGSVLTLSGFLIRDQLILRSLVTLGTVMFVVYYLALPTPLMEKAAWNSATIAANILMIALISLDRTHLSMSANDKQVYEQMNSLRPGQFRKLIKLAEWQTTDKDIVLTTKDQPVPALYFLVEGRATVERDGKKIDIGSSSFVGELAFILGNEASATVTAKAGSKLVRWERKQTKDFLEKNAEIKKIFDLMLNADMARKLYA